MCIRMCMCMCKCVRAVGHCLSTICMRASKAVLWLCAFKGKNKLNAYVTSLPLAGLQAVYREHFLMFGSHKKVMSRARQPSPAVNSSLRESKLGAIQAIGLRTSSVSFEASETDASYAATYFRPSTIQQRTQRHNIHVPFLADQRGDHFLNRLTSMIGQKVHKQGFCHVEIVIPDMEKSTLSCPSYLSSSIYNSEAVTLTQTKTFVNPGYTVLTFTVSGTELSSIADYLFESKRMDLKFDSFGMYLAALPFQLNPFVSDRTTFCSKHVTRALKAANIEVVTGLNENIVTPSKLYKVLYEQLPKERMVIGSVQFKQKALVEQGAIFSIQ